MGRRKKNNQLFVDYYDEWVETYKEGLVADVTLQKYHINGRRLRSLIPNVTLNDLNRRTYQQMLNEYALTHEKQTTLDFHHQVKGCIQDAFHDGLIDRDPTYKAIIKGKEPRKKKQKFLHTEELKKLVRVLDLGTEINMDWFIMLSAKTGLRFAETLGLTPNDFDFTTNTLNVDKTWNYKSATNRFDKTKNVSSVRKIALDWQIIGQFGPLIKDLPENEPVFVKRKENGNYVRAFNSTYNNHLKKRCLEADIPIVTLHSLRHTHASILLSAGVSMHSIADRLGHSDVTTTQEVYTHIIDELAQKDNQLMIGTLTAIA